MQEQNRKTTIPVQLNFQLTVTDHPDIINCIKQRAYKIIYDGTDGICIYDQINQLYYADALSNRATEIILKNTKQLTGDLVARGAIMKHVCEQYRMLLSKPYQFAVFMETVPQKATPIPYQIHKLTKDAIPYICAHYSYKPLANPEYIEERIEAGMLGVFQDHQPVAFIGTHDNGSIGLLEVEAMHQRKGIGAALTLRMIKEQMKKGLIPYAELFTDNKKSHKMAEKLNLKLSKSLIYWVYLDVD